jgi:hypothetical protein
MLPVISGYTKIFQRKVGSSENALQLYDNMGLIFGKKD